MKIPIWKRSGLAQVYIRHEPGFHERLIPAYDSAPVSKAEMTTRQVSTLNGIIARYMKKCQDSNEKKGLVQ